MTTEQRGETPCMVTERVWAVQLHGPCHDFFGVVDWLGRPLAVAIVAHLAVATHFPDWPEDGYFVDPTEASRGRRTH